MQDIFALDQRKSKADLTLSTQQRSGFAVTCRTCPISGVVGASRWQASTFQLGVVLTAAGLLVMLLTALKSFGAAELLGQVSSVPNDSSHSNCA